MDNKMKVTAGTIARTICLALALINQIFAASGHSVINISSDDVNTLIATGFTIAAAVAAWWKNNSFTQPALKADELMQEERANENH